MHESMIPKYHTNIVMESYEDVEYSWNFENYT